ncbi:MAG: 3',5'-cyclic-nucleotide phosphodiesterase, partial [uncultured Acidimicrobiales bacterium]
GTRRVRDRPTVRSPLRLAVLRRRLAGDGGERDDRHQPGPRRDRRRPHRRGLRRGVPHRPALPRAPVRGRLHHARHPRQPRLQECRLSPLPRHLRRGRRGREGRPGDLADHAEPRRDQPVPGPGRGHRLLQARPGGGRGRTGALPVDTRPVRRRGGLQDLRAAPPSGAGSRHRPRAQHRVGRRRRARPARRAQGGHGAVRPQARAARVAARPRAAGELGNGVVAPGAGLHAAVLQRAGDHPRRGAGDPEVPRHGRAGGGRARPRPHGPHQQPRPGCHVHQEHVEAL